LGEFLLFISTKRKEIKHFPVFIQLPVFVFLCTVDPAPLRQGTTVIMAALHEIGVVAGLEGIKAGRP
jgi:hypothetical protein